MTVTVTFTGDVPTILFEMRGFLDSLSAAPATDRPRESANEVASEAPRRRGRPPKAAAEHVPEPPESPAETTAPEPEPTPAPEPEPTPAPEPEAAPVAASVDQATVRKVLIDVVKRLGRDACGELCRKHGGPNLSALAEDVYPAIYADAQKMLRAASE